MLAKIPLCGLVAALFDGVGFCAPRQMKGFSHGNAGAVAGGAAALAAATAGAGVAAKGLLTGAGVVKGGVRF